MRYARLLLRIALGACALLAEGVGANAVAQSAPRALVYCPIGIDTSGCDNIVAALGAAGTGFGAIDRGWDGTSGTVDLASADLRAYAVVVVPSLADGADGRPYDRLRGAIVAGRLKAAVTGRQAIWSGTPDLGTAGATEKTILLQSLAAWAASGNGTGLVGLLDGSDSTAQRYDWVAGISALAVVADSTPGTYATVRPLTATGAAITAPGGQALAYANMAAFGLHAGSGTTEEAADSATGMPILVSTPGASAAAPAPAPTGLRALVYCPVADAGGCDNIVAALTAAGTPFAGGADRGYDGSTGTVDLRTADLSAYGVFVVPSLADGADGQPYAVLRDPVVAGRLKPLLAGPVAVWSGTPDLGDSSRTQKNVLITNLAKWAAAAAQATAGARGLVALQDASDSVPARYSWVSLISRASVATDTTLDVYSNVQALTPTAVTLLNDGTGLQLGYTNMASFGLLPGTGLGADATGGRTSAIVLATSASAGGAVAGFATVTTDREDYQPGDTITVTGAGWAPGETVSLLFHEEVSPPIHPDKTLTAVADASGHILNHQYEVESTDVGVRFALVATGQTSGRTAQATFTDAVNFQSVAASTQTPTPIAPGSSATYTITVAFSGNNTPTCSVALSVTTALPTGATPSFSPASVASPTGVNQTSTLTISTTGATPAGTTSFTVQGVGTACTGTKTATGTLDIRRPSTTTVAGPASSSFGGSVTFTATVTGGGPTPTGTVQFKDGGTNLGAVQTLASGSASITTSALTTGSHTITAVYSGDASYTGSTSPNFNHTVNQASQSITFGALANKTFGDAPFTVSATATSGLTVIFSSLTTGVCTVSGSTVTLVSAGTCTVAADQPGNTNFLPATRVTQGFTVNQAPTTITWSNPAAIDYGTALDATQLNATASVPGSFVYSPTAGTVLNVGNNQTLSVTFTPTDPNHATSTKSVLIDVRKVNATISWSNPADITYGTALSATQLNATATGAGGVSLTGTFVYAPAAGTVLNAGNGQTLSVTFQPTDPNYKNTTASVQINVLKATPTVTWANPADITYGTALSATQLNATATGAGGVSLTGTFVYAPAAGTVLNAGNGQTLSVTFQPTNPNYKNTTASVQINVLKATPTVTWANPADITYGTALSATQLNATASVAGSFVYTPAATTVLNAGSSQTLSVDFTPTDATNYNSVLGTTVHINVLKATPTVTWANPADITYGAALSATQLNATAHGVGGVTVSGAFAYSPAAGTVLHAGSQALGTDFTSSDGNYTNVTGATAHITVNPAPLTAKAGDNSRLYGDPNPVLTAAYTGFVNGDTPSVVTGAPSLSTTATASSSVAGSPYAITWGTPIGVSAGPDYTITTMDGALTITPAPLSVKANNKTKLYGQSVPSLDGVIDGIRNADDISATYVAGVGALVTEATPVSASPYPIVPTLHDPGNKLPNYDVTVVNGGLKIDPAPLTITASSASKLYGSPAPAVTPVYDGFVLQETDAVLSPKPVCTTGATESTPVANSPAATRCVGAGAANYAISYVNGALTITPAPLTVKANDASRLYGQANPAFTAGYAGFVLGEGPSALDGTLGFTTAADAHSHVGSYDVTPLGLTAANYAITLVAGHLGVTPALVTITAGSTSKLYGAPVPVIQPGYAGFVLGENETSALSFAPPTCGTTATNATPVLSSPVATSCAGAAAHDYTFGYVNGTLTILRAPLTATADPKTKVQGDVNPMLTATYTGFVLGEGPSGVVIGTPSLTTTATTGSTPGSYPIAWQVPQGVSAANYVFTFVDGALQVTPNQPPVVGTVTGPSAPVAVGTAVTISSSFTDPDAFADIAAGGTFTVTIGWGDGATTTTTRTAVGTITGSHTYLAAGVYTVTVTVSDKIPGNTDSETLQYVVVYDPNGGFVTGGGWINSPAGAYAPDPTLTGKANFGFVSKYQKGATIPTGDTEFQFQTAGLNFKSTSYDWLVISGSKAQYKGAGTVNGQPGYSFMLSAIDGSPDMFRIKITTAGGGLVYDNQMNAADTSDPTTVLGGGSIVVHK